MSIAKRSQTTHSLWLGIPAAAADQRPTTVEYSKRESPSMLEVGTSPLKDISGDSIHISIPDPSALVVPTLRLLRSPLRAAARGLSLRRLSPLLVLLRQRSRSPHSSRPSMADFFVGASVSLLSISTTLLIGAGCFALGFLFAHKETKSGFPFPFSWIRSLADNKRVAVPVDDGPAEPKFVERAVQKKPALLEIENLAEILEDFKMVGQYVLVVRNDLKMGKGKIAAQCSHATLGLYKKLLHKAPKALSRFKDGDGYLG
ncbi:hypothetical protein B296_00007598 [Ensete ventricosum]|uniref:peptidyl-tRNA hydrolase n=1 Tax=Ensete ventricosum TaxID=4639 RepID=A0A427AWK4_ENSVE|nr:hypothetical protein B296_00007598 [Ensete ventricosum]